MGREGLSGIIWLPQVGKTLRVWRAKVGIQYKDKSWWQRTEVNQSRTFWRCVEALEDEWELCSRVSWDIFD